MRCAGLRYVDRARDRARPPSEIPAPHGHACDGLHRATLMSAHLRRPPDARVADRPRHTSRQGEASRARSTTPPWSIDTAPGRERLRDQARGVRPRGRDALGAAPGRGLARRPPRGWPWRRVVDPDDASSGAGRHARRRLAGPGARTVQDATFQAAFAGSSVLVARPGRAPRPAGLSAPRRRSRLGEAGGQQAARCAPAPSPRSARRRLAGGWSPPRRAPAVARVRADPRRQGRRSKAAGRLVRSRGRRVISSSSPGRRSSRPR